MRKFISLVLVAMLLLMCTACGGGEDNPSGTNPSTDNPGTSSSETGNNGDTTDKPVADITMSDVMSHAESPASDFFCNDDGNGGVIIMEYLGEAEIVVIPETINGKSVSKINKYVFANDSTVKGIKLSSSIKEIGGFAFAQNKNLQYVVFGDGVEIVGESAFQACTSLKEVTINSGVKTIKQLAFSQCTALKSVTLPESIETIEVIAFNLMDEDFKIIGKAGSVAETYAASASITFEAK